MGGVICMRYVDTARRVVEDALQRPLPDAMWDHLLEVGRVDAFMRGDSDLSSLTAEASSLFRRFSSPVPMLDEAPKMLTGGECDRSQVSVLEEALSRVAADLAARDPDVHAFRADP